VCLVRLHLRSLDRTVIDLQMGGWRCYIQVGGVAMIGHGISIGRSPDLGLEMVGHILVSLDQGDDHISRLHGYQHTLTGCACTGLVRQE